MPALGEGNLSLVSYFYPRQFLAAAENISCWVCQILVWTGMESVTTGSCGFLTQTSVALYCEMLPVLDE